MNVPDLFDMALRVVVLLFAIIIHEVAHGYVAWRFGDPTARIAGRLTLNPVPHIDLVGTIILPALLLFSGSSVVFGWAKPVPVNPLNFRHLRAGEVAVSAAGPLSNLSLAAGFALLFHLGPQVGADNLGFMKLVYYGVSINIFLALFNLVPIPPLDGSHLLAAILPTHLARLYEQLEPFGFILILVLFYTGLMNLVLMPIYAFLFRFFLGF
jgi:Zn-dependent protease